MTTLRLTLEVTYNDNGVDVYVLKDMLSDVVNRAMNVGTITGDTNAEVDSYTHTVEVVPELTDEQKREKNYLNLMGVACPFCNSTNIEGDGTLNCDGDSVSNGVECNDCNKTWQDIYTLSSIVED